MNSVQNICKMTKEVTKTVPHSRVRNINAGVVYRCEKKNDNINCTKGYLSCSEFNLSANLGNYLFISI